MHYYIDGYNLMFRLLHAGEDITTQRMQIIQDLNQKIQLLDLDATLVFDAYYQPGEGSRSHYQHLKILFTSEGETADEYILHELKSEPNPRQQTVVTSDKKLAWLARRQAALTETVEDFMIWLNKRCKNKLRLLKKKQEQPQQAILQQKKEPSPPKAKQPPSTQSTPEECFEFYLDQFETNFEKSAPPPKKEKNPSPKEQHLFPKKEKVHEEKQISNEERWLKAFERRLEQDL